MNAPPNRAVAGARAIIRRAIQARVFPAAAIDVGSSSGPLWSDALGTLTFDEGAFPVALDTPFDLASLTKVIATTSLVMDLVRAGRVRLDEPLSGCFQEWRADDRAAAIVRDLLEHDSGLPARLLDLPPRTRREFEHEICRIALEYPTGSRALYSDLDFILLGFLVEDRGGAPLAGLFERLMSQAGLLPAAGPLTFSLSNDIRQRAAPTTPLSDDVRAGRRLVGEVHDSYAAALGGAAGHAGLFASASAVGGFARLVLRGARGDWSAPAPFSPDLVAQFTTKSRVPGSSRALGWDTMLPTSSCGTRMSTTAFGHVGFTGTSMWIDPARDRYVVLLTNRVCDGGSSAEMQAVRRAFHDALADV
jgi:CubicO group peptidase (beta-lactamase class C family)